MAGGEILPIAYYAIVSASRNELTVVAERPEILDLTARAEWRIGWARGVLDAKAAHPLGVRGTHGWFRPLKNVRAVPSQSPTFATVSARSRRSRTTRRYP